MSSDKDDETGSEGDEEDEVDGPPLQLQQPTFSQMEEGLSQERLKATHQNVTMPGMPMIPPMFHHRVAYEAGNNMYANQYNQYNPFVLSVSTSGRHSAPTLPTTLPQKKTSTQGAKKKVTAGAASKAAKAAIDPTKDTTTKRKRKKAPSQRDSAAPINNNEGGPTSHYSDEELDILLGLIKEYLPIGNIAWMRVVDEFNKRVSPARVRNKASILRKYNSLHQKLMPTGDPNMPPHVKIAKHINYLIMDKSEMINAEEMDEEEEAEVQVVDEADTDPLEVNANPPDPTEPTEPAAAFAPVPSSTTFSSRNTRAKNKQGRSETREFLELFMATEKAHYERLKLKDERDMARQKAKEKQDLARQKAKDKKDRQQWKAIMGIVTGAVQIIGQGRASLPLAPLDSSSSESVSSIDSGDSPPTVKVKIGKGKKPPKTKQTDKSTGEE
jgi:hypothetical protein